MDRFWSYVNPTRIEKPANPKDDETLQREHEETQTSVGRVSAIFWAWKALLLGVACASPGLGYDTSTRILLDSYPLTKPTTGTVSLAVEHLVLRLMRWDAIYFASLSTRGHIFEQEWAFSWAWTKINSSFTEVMISPTFSPIVRHALAGIILSHLCHYLAVNALYKTITILVPDKPRLAFTAACLHIISPAGIFLSAPYAESGFALLNFFGTLSYVQAAKTRFFPAINTPHTEASWIVRAGFFFGVAAMVRSNGLFGVIPFAWDTLSAVSQGKQLFTDSILRRRFSATLAAGTLVPVGFAVTQIMALAEFCTPENPRPWCTRSLPSIYTFVQEHYWGVGFLRYWTPANLPLFVIAAPMLFVMLRTGTMALTQPHTIVNAVFPQRASSPSSAQASLLLHVLPRLAVPQILLALLAATNFHVQIINRISSGYPLWYLVLAVALLAADGRKSQRIAQKSHIEWLIKGMVVYALVQAALFASFLPPA